MEPEGHFLTRVGFSPDPKIGTLSFSYIGGTCSELRRRRGCVFACRATCGISLVRKA